MSPKTAKSGFYQASLTFDQIPEDKDAGPSILIVDDDPLAMKRLKLICETTELEEPLQIFTASSISEALDIIETRQIQVVLLDKEIHLSKNKMENGIENIPDLLKNNPGLQILVVTASKDFQDCIEAIRLGAFGFLSKAYPDEIILNQIKKCIEVSKLTYSKLRQDRVEVSSRKDLRIPGDSPAIQALYSRLQAVSETNRPILLTGETGTGKTTAAKIIHERRKSYLKQGERPFLALNIAAIQSSLVESELFGHEKGAFTDAKTARPGYIELANNGTLFLDEIGEASLELQAKLLKVLDDGKFYRLGSSKERASSFKLVCATNKNLEEMVRAGTFREDLYMRISTFVISIPALHERPSDIPEIIKAVLPKACIENNVQISFSEIPNDFIEHLKSHPVPGNIRGVERQLAQLFVYAPRDRQGRPVLTQWKKIPGLYLSQKTATVKRGQITLDELRSRSYNVVSEDAPSFFELLEEIGDRIAADTLKRYPSLRSAAQALKISPSALCQRIKRTKQLNQRSSA